MIIATRGGKKRSFDPVLWREMPSHKYGWIQSAEEPEEVTILRQRKITQQDVIENPDLKGLAGKVVSAPAEDPEEVTAPAGLMPKSEIETIREALAADGVTAPKMHHKTRKSLEEKLKALESGGNTE